jgi:hypothetical protein
MAPTRGRTFAPRCAQEGNGVRLADGMRATGIAFPGLRYNSTDVRFSPGRSMLAERLCVASERTDAQAIEEGEAVRSRSESVRER